MRAARTWDGVLTDQGLFWCTLCGCCSHSSMWPHLQCCTGCDTEQAAAGNIVCTAARLICSHREDSIMMQQGALATWLAWQSHVYGYVCCPDNHGTPHQALWEHLKAHQPPAVWCCA